MTVTVKYTPANPVGQQWSQTPPVVHVPPGSTEIDWNVQVSPSSAGDIIFGNPGIEFTGTGQNAWPGTPPSGNDDGWSATINNTLVKGQNAVDFYYCVNALYTADGGSQIAVTYDPEVEEDPPIMSFAVAK
jgi:hypothetical protein